MLECHRVDNRIIQAIRQRRFGATVREITEALAADGGGPVSNQSIQRHLPGLLAMKMIRGEIQTLDNGRKVCRWIATTKATTTF